MAIALKNLYGPAYLPGVLTTIVTAANIQRVDSITLHNTHTSAVVAQLTVVKSGSPFLVYNYSLDQDETMVIKPGWVLDSSTTMLIQGYAATASKVTCFISGVEVS